MKDELTRFLARDFYDNSIQTWLVGLGAAVVLFVVLRLIEELVVTRIQKLTTRTSTKWDDIFIAALRRTKLWFLGIVAIVAGGTFLELPKAGDRILERMLIIAFLVQSGVWVSSAFMAWLKKYREEQIEEDAASVMTMNAFGFVVRLALWSTVLLLALDNLGVDVTALVAGLGVGGIAVALAVQNILGDLFSSLSIVLDKPFVIGDFVIVGDLMGSVENIGIKTTRIRSLSGEQLIFSNTDLLGSRIRNFGRMNERRVVFKLGVVYGTPKRKLEKIPRIIRDAIEAQENTRFDRSHFFEYGDFSLDFESVFYVLDRDYNLYMDVQQAINLRIYERFEEEGIEFAFPTRTVILEEATQGGADESNGRASSEDTDRSREAYL